MNACRNIVTRVLAPLAASAALLFAGTPMFAQAAGTGVHDLGIFQLDGDAFVGTCGGTATGPSAFGGLTGCTGDDWDNLYTCHGTFGDCTTNTAGNPSGGSCTPGQAPPNNCASVIAQFKVDPAPFSIFTGGGSKDEQDLSSWQWVDGSVPDKDDIIEAGAALYIVPSNLPRAGHHILYFMANRFANNGDAQIGVWFFQNAVEAAGTGVHASPFVDPVNGGPAHHRVGDILILSNFVQGGGNANIQVYAVTAANGVGFIKGKGNKIICPTNVPGIPQEVAPSSDGICTTQLVNGTAGANGVCNDPDQTACAATNGIVEASLDPAFFAKSGAGSGQYPVVGFFEGGIDLTALNLANECFSNFLVVTRSSQSITAVLKDFTLGEFQRCAAKISTQIIEPDTPDFEVTGQSVIPGTVIYDRATVESAATGVANDPGHGSTTGTCAALGLARDCTVTFKLYNVTVNPTTGDVQGCGAGGSTLVSAGFTNPQSSFCETSGVGSGKCIAKTTNFTTQVPPGYSFTATYNGDSNNAAISLTTEACEIVLVGKLESTIATDIFKSSTPVGQTCVTTGNAITDGFVDISQANPGGSTVNVCDKATVTPLTSGPTPTGTVTFQRYKDGACTTADGPTEVVGLSSGVGLSSVFALGANGLSYKATYSGDPVYNASTISRCEPVCAIDTSK